MPDGNGGAVAIWIDTRYGAYDLYTQKITSGGNTQWGINGREVSNQINDPYYTMSPDPSNSAMLVTWGALIISDYVIRAQKVNVSDGTLAWGANGKVICSVDEAKIESVITHAGNSGAIIAWTDERNLGTTNLDIYAGHVVDGALPVSLITFDTQLKNNDVLLQWSTSSEQNTSHLFPNPAKDVLNLQFSGANENGMIQIFDLSGKKVKEQRINFNGNSKTTIDIGNLPKGIFNLIFTTREKTERQKFVKQ